MPTLALSMIVKDGESTLDRCLDSVRGVVDEIVIADTGSTDGSLEIARQYRARVTQIPWEKDFAKARNLSLAEVHSDWVLILDADEVLGPSACKLIPPLLECPGVAGYMVQIRNYLLEMNCHLWDQRAQPNTAAPDFARQYPAYVQHQNVRLFRRHPDVWFVGRIHETVGNRILDLGMKIEPANFLIHHLGFIADDQTLAKKWEFYRELGREKVRERPEDANAHFELGIEEFEHFHNNDEALRLFTRACELNPRFGVAWLFRGLALSRAGMHSEALACLEQAEANGGRVPLVYEGRGDASYGLGDFGPARCAYLRALELAGDSPQIESKLGLTEVRLGQSAAGLDRLRRAIEQEPQSGNLYDRMIGACAWLGQLPEAAKAAEAKLACAGQHPESFMRAASLRAQLQDWPRVISLLKQGIDLFPEAEKLREALAEAERQSDTAQAEARGDKCYRQHDFESACKFYQQAVECSGSGPQIESKLGLAEVRLGQASEGLDRMRRAIGRAPKSPELYDRLLGAFVLLGRLGEAAETAEAKLRETGPQPNAYLRAASLRAQLGQWPQVMALLREGLGRFPGEGKLRAAVAEVEAHLSGAVGR